MTILKIVIKKEWFDKIKSGEKKIEYREIKPFWTSRLYDKNGKSIGYDRVEFINGYNADAKRLIVEFKGVSRKSGLYHIKLGNRLKK